MARRDSGSVVTLLDARENKRVFVKACLADAIRTACYMLDAVLGGGNPTKT